MRTGYCYRPVRGGYCYRPGRARGYCYRPHRGMGEVTADNLLRMGAAVFFMGAGFILVSGHLERKAQRRRKRRRG